MKEDWILCHWYLVTSVIFSYGSLLGLKSFRGYFPSFLDIGYLCYQSILKPQFKILNHETEKYEN